MTGLFANHLTLLHNPSCSKSQAAKALLEARKVAFRERRYLDEPLSTAEVEELARRLRRPASDWVRRIEGAFTEAGLHAASTDVSILAAMARFPILIERPVLIARDGAVIGRPPGRILELTAWDRSLPVDFPTHGMRRRIVNRRCGKILGVGRGGTNRPYRALPGSCAVRLSGEGSEPGRRSIQRYAEGDSGKPLSATLRRWAARHGQVIHWQVSAAKSGKPSPQTAGNHARTDGGGGHGQHHLQTPDDRCQLGRHINDCHVVSSQS